MSVKELIDMLRKYDLLLPCVEELITTHNSAMLIKEDHAEFTLDTQEDGSGKIDIQIGGVGLEVLYSIVGDVVISMMTYNSDTSLTKLISELKNRGISCKEL